MYRNQLLRVAVTVVGLVAGLSLLHCNQPASVIGPSSGGSGGSGGGGSTTVRHDAGPPGSDLPPAVVNLDVQPIWYGTSDAPQGDDTPPAPSSDVNCGLTESSTTRQPVDVMLVLDRSASMNYSIAEDCYCTTSAATGGTVCSNTSGCTTRWDSIKPAVTSTLTNSQYVNWGLKFFPTAGGSSTNYCTESTTMEVNISATSATTIETQVNNATLSLSTPTAAALTAATNYLTGLNDGNKKFILLATDGEPNCGKSDAGVNDINTSDVPNTADAASKAKDAGILVYVIGIGPTLGNLTQIAQSGGTTNFYPVTSPQQLTDALNSISKFVGSCTFNSKDPPPDPENVAVYVNKQLIAKDGNDGWEYGATNQDIELHGSYCDMITNGEDVTVQILFGCPGAPPFPPFVP